MPSCALGSWLHARIGIKEDHGALQRIGRYLTKVRTTTGIREGLGGIPRTKRSGTVAERSM
jgi:hypothetical protein